MEDMNMGYRGLLVLNLGVMACMMLGGCASVPRQTPGEAVADLSAVEFRGASPNMVVSDLDAAKKFYMGKLGFSQVGSGPSYVTLSRGTAVIGLIESSSGAGKSRCYLTVSDPARLCQDYKTLDVNIVQDLQSWGQHTEFSIEDPEGNRMDIGN
jgi:catechol 2,3-dioxygenase-like lactoylglutathione lyase family enzyme